MLTQADIEFLLWELDSMERRDELARQEYEEYLDEVYYQECGTDPIRIGETPCNEIQVQRAPGIDEDLPF